MILACFPRIPEIKNKETRRTIGVRGLRAAVCSVVLLQDLRKRFSLSDSLSFFRLNSIGKAKLETSVSREGGRFENVKNSSGERKGRYRFAAAKKESTFSTQVAVVPMTW